MLSHAPAVQCTGFFPLNFWWGWDNLFVPFGPCRARSQMGNLEKKMLLKPQLPKAKFKQLVLFYEIQLFKVHVISGFFAWGGPPVPVGKNLVNPPHLALVPFFRPEPVPHHLTFVPENFCNFHTDFDYF